MAGNNPTSIMVQPRDLRLLEALDAMRVVTAEQAAVIGGFPNLRVVNRRLLALYRAGLLKRTFIGKGQFAYWPANAELQKARRKGDQSLEPAALFLRHRLEINRVNLLVQYAAIPVAGWWFASWRSFQQTLSDSLPLIPDGFFELRSAVGSRSVFVEVDLGTEALPVLTRKAELYVQLATSGDFGKIFGRSQFRVLLITTAPRRLDNIRAAIAKVTDKIFWFSTLDANKPEKFWTACWQRPVGDQSQSFL